MNPTESKRSITLPKRRKPAHGQPGADPRWTSGAKTIVGTACSPRSRVWFTINNGAVAEVYYPDVDTANTRVLRFLVTGEDGFFSNEVWDAEHHVEWLADGVPGCRIDSKSKCGRYEMEKEIISDPVRDTLLLRVCFTPKTGQKLRLFLSMNSHVADQGADNCGWAGDYKGVPMLFASRGGVALALAVTPQPTKQSVGYIGTTDAYTLLSKRKPLAEANWAERGNVGLAAELDLSKANEGSAGSYEFVVALAFGSDATEAAHQARGGLLQDFEKARDLYVQQWKEEQSRYADVADLSGSPLDMYRVSTAVLETHQSKRFPGGFVASLSLPWGFVRGDKDLGGYHVVWPRDLTETAMGKLASGDAKSARSSLFYLACTQDDDGGWSQNMWLDGTPHWNAIQMDGIALPILLADKLRRDDALEGYDPRPMIHKAARYVLQQGPVTGQDRWEVLPGYSPYSMAVQVAALLASAECAEQRGRSDQAEFLRVTADAWNDAIEELTYVQGTGLATEHGVDGYYVRMAPPSRIERRKLGNLRVTMTNLPFWQRQQLAADLVSPDALALVRFGLRDPHDLRIQNTVKVIDATLKRQTRTGPAWRRSSKDGYGENAEGKPFKGVGVGHSWPLLAGERGHFEVALGERAKALDLLQTMSRQTSECGMLPEQIWDEEDLPERELFNGAPAGSGMPLVWAHAEYIKLLRSLHEGAVWDRVPQTTERYIESRHPASFQIWRPKQRRRYVSQGKDLRVDLDNAARIRWEIAGEWLQGSTQDSELGLHTLLLPISSLPAGATVKVRIEYVGSSESPHDDSFRLTVRGA